MTKYRIRAVAPDKYIVEYETWYGLWRCALWELKYIDWEREIFSSVQEAQDALFAEVEEQNAIAKHLAQEPVYFVVA